MQTFQAVKDLDIRLRSYSADDELGGDHPIIPRIGPKDLMPILATLPARSSLRPIGGFRYKLRRNHILDVAELYRESIIRSYQELPNFTLEDLTFSELLQGWAILLAISHLHETITLIMSDHPSDFTTSVNWPAIHREKAEWLRWFSALRNGEAVMKALTMNPKERSADIVVTPIIPITQTTFGMIPAVSLAANVPRNLLVLTARRFQLAYSSYSAEREDKIIADLLATCGRYVVASSINLPKHDGRQLPDINVLLHDAANNLLVVAEVKWQLSASDTKEVVSRNDYLKKGQGQLSAIKRFLISNPDYLRRRGLVDFDVSEANLTFLLLCKGHLGSADVLSPDSIMADYDVFTRYVQQESLSGAIERVSRYDYLPTAGRDFVVDQLRVRFGAWTRSNGNTFIRHS